ncbi:MAG: PQQ-binding-like beta-propeller repeat protein [Opitutaceae bacterium]
MHSNSVSISVGLLLLGAALVSGVGVTSHAAETVSERWPQFRGVNGSGVGAPDAHPPISFGPTEAVLWKSEVPWSPSSPSVWGERIFLTTFHDGQLETRCLDRADGRLRWARAIKPASLEEFHRTDGSPAASTPVTDGKFVVSYFGSFGLVCHDFDGNEVWRHPLSLLVSAGLYGTGTSPIIVGGRVLLSRDQHEFSSLLALDLATGKKLWETPRLDSSGSFGTPAHWNNAGVDEIVLAGPGRLKGYDLATGVERWVIEGITSYICTTPVVADGVLYFAAWSNGAMDSPVTRWEVFLKNYDKNADGVVAYDEIPAEKRDYMRGLDVDRDGKYTKEDWEALTARAARTENLMLAVKPGGRGDISETHVTWKFRRGLPYVSSPLFYDGRIYLVKDGGLMTSVDAKTGEAFYAQQPIGTPGNYYASPVAADGRIYVASLLGKVTVVKAGGDNPEILHQVDFGARILATPVLVGDKLYLRTATHLWAFGKK